MKTIAPLVACLGLAICVFGQWWRAERAEARAREWEQTAKEAITECKKAQTIAEESQDVARKAVAYIQSQQ